jgi:hypothetical protein
MSANGNGPGHAPAKGKHASTSLYVRSAGGLKLRDEKTRRLVRRMRIAMPWLEDADEPTARGWAQIEILADMAHQVLRTIGIINGKGSRAVCYPSSGSFGRRNSPTRANSG